MRVEGDLQHLGADPAVEALHHAVRLRRARLGVAALGAELGASSGESRREAAAVVGQHVGELERERRRGFSEKGDGAPFRLVVLDGQVDGAGPAVDGDEQIALAPLAIGRLQLRQVLDVDVHEAEVVVAESALSLGGAVGRELDPAVQPLALQDAKDAVAVEMRQEVAQDEREVVEREVGGPAQGADDRTLLLAGLPGQPVRPGGAVQAVGGAALAPLAHGLGADAVALGQDAAGLGGARDLDAHGGGGAGVRVDVQHGLPPSPHGARQALEAESVVGDGHAYRVPTMLRSQTALKKAKAFDSQSSK